MFLRESSSLRPHQPGNQNRIAVTKQRLWLCAYPVLTVPPVLSKLRPSLPASLQPSSGSDTPLQSPWPALLPFMPGPHGCRGRRVEWPLCHHKSRRAGERREGHRKPGSTHPSGLRTTPLLGSPQPWQRQSWVLPSTARHCQGRAGHMPTG